MQTIQNYKTGVFTGDKVDDKPTLFLASTAREMTGSGTNIGSYT